MMCKFTDSDSKDALYVNPALVRVARETAGGTVIIFDHQQSVFVLEKIEAVIKALEEENLVLS